MTATITGNSPLSQLTAGSLIDLGYTGVDLAKADSFSVLAPPGIAPTVSPTLSPTKKATGRRLNSLRGEENESRDLAAAATSIPTNSPTTAADAISGTPINEIPFTGTVTQFQAQSTLNIAEIAGGAGGGVAFLGLAAIVAFRRRSAKRMYPGGTQMQSPNPNFGTYNNAPANGYNQNGYTGFGTTFDNFRQSFQPSLWAQNIRASVMGGGKTSFSNFRQSVMGGFGFGRPPPPSTFEAPQNKPNDMMGARPGYPQAQTNYSSSSSNGSQPNLPSGYGYPSQNQQPPQGYNPPQQPPQGYNPPQQPGYPSQPSGYSGYPPPQQYPPPGAYGYPPQYPPRGYS